MLIMIDRVYQRITQNKLPQIQRKMQEYCI